MGHFCFEVWTGCSIVLANIPSPFCQSTGPERASNVLGCYHEASRPKTHAGTCSPAGNVDGNEHEESDDHDVGEEEVLRIVDDAVKFVHSLVQHLVAHVLQQVEEGTEILAWTSKIQHSLHRRTFLDGLHQNMHSIHICSCPFMHNWEK